MGKWWITSLAFFPIVLAAACDLPRDAAGTFERVRHQHVLRVGFSERPPWVEVENGRPTGIEPRMVEAFASSLGAKVAWVAGTESSLVKALRERSIDVLIGGHEMKSPWINDYAAATEPYLRTALIVAAPDGHLPTAGSSLQGLTVAHARLRPDIAALITARGATPIAAVDLSGRLAAVYDFDARALGLEPAGIVLARAENVLLVAPGESRLLYELDRFLARAGNRAARRSMKPEGA